MPMTMHSYGLLEASRSTALSLRNLFCGRTVSCCCLPVRIGASVMSLLGIVFGGMICVVLWVEVARTPDMTSAERAGFVVAGLMETLLFVASVFGFIGATAPKQSFVQPFAYFISGHFILNTAAVTYLLHVVARFPTAAIGRACQEIIQNVQVKDQCIVSLIIPKWMYFVVATIVLVIELYGAIVTCHYVSQLRGEELIARKSRMAHQEAIRLIKNARYSSLPDGQIAGTPGLTFPHYSTKVYDPYEEVTRSSYVGPSSACDDDDSALPVEAGYGGGLWTHEEISTEEKTWLKERDNGVGLSSLAKTAKDADEEIERRESFVEDLPAYGPPRI